METETYLIILERRSNQAVLGYWSGRRYFNHTPFDATFYDSLSAARQALTRLRRGRWGAEADRLQAALRIVTETEMQIVWEAERAADLAEAYGRTLHASA